MDFEKKVSPQKNVGIIVGFISMFLIFSTILYYTLKITEKLPLPWNYFDVLLVVFVIIIIGKVLGGILKNG